MSSDPTRVAERNAAFKDWALSSGKAGSEWSISREDAKVLFGDVQQRLQELEEALKEIEGMNRWGKDTKPWIDRARRALFTPEAEPHLHWPTVRATPEAEPPWCWKEQFDASAAEIRRALFTPEAEEPPG